MSTSSSALAQSTTPPTAVPDATIGPFTVVGASGKTGSRVADPLERRGLSVRHVTCTSPMPFPCEDERAWAGALGAGPAAYVTTRATSTGAWVQ